MYCHSCPVQVVLSQMLCPRCCLSTGTIGSSQLPCLSWMACHRFPFSCLSCPLLAVIFSPFCLCFLSWLYCPVCLSEFPVPVLLSRLSCPACPVLAVLSRLVLSKLSYTSCPAWLSCPGHPVLAVLTLLPCPTCPVLAAQPRHPCPQLS
jgi:hypothetical protein